MFLKNYYFYRDSDIHMMPFDSRSLYEDNRAYSMDSLFDTTSTASVDDVTGCCNVQCNQIFIGMITMQYQARQVSYKER